MRAIAVLSVVGFHAGLPWCSGGFVGVDMFFVVSGFLITSLIYDEMKRGSFSFKAFYLRRAKRILPALFALLFVFLSVALILLSPQELKDFADSSIATVLSGSNFYFWHTSGYFSAGSDFSPLLMTWSLGIEEQFYLLFPLLLLALVKRGRRPTQVILFALCALSFALSAIVVLSHPTAAFYLFPTRAWELTVGCLLAIFQLESRQSGFSPGGFNLNSRLSNVLAPMGLLLALAPVLLYTRETRFPGPSAALPVLGTAILIATPASFLNRRLLSVKPLVFLGAISYSWYLWHWPLLSFARLISDSTLSLTCILAILLLSLVLGVASYRFIEQPLRRSNRPFVPRLGYAAGFLLLVAASAVHLTGGLSRRSPQLAALEVGGEALRADKCLSIYGNQPPNFSAACVAANPSEPAIALVGDSHAAALAGSFRKLARRNGVGFDQLTKVSCPALVGATRNLADHPGHDRECAAFRKTSWDFIASHPGIKTVVLATYWSAPFVNESAGERYLQANQTSQGTSPALSLSNFRSALENTVASLESAGKQVVLLEDVPTFEFDPVRRVRARSIGPRLFLTRLLSRHFDAAVGAETRARSVSAADNLASSVLEQVAARHPGVVVYDPKRELCDASQCFFHDGSAFFYADAQHLSASGADRALRDLPLSRLLSK